MPQVDPSTDLSAVEAGLDALDTPTSERRESGWVRFLRSVVPPLVALALVIVVWQVVWAAAILTEAQVPAPLEVWNRIWEISANGKIVTIVWTSVHRAVLGFVAGVVIGTPLGLLVAKVRVVRAAIGPLLSGLQSLPSVAWVPAAVIWFGLKDPSIYFVVLAGSVPSIANGIDLLR